jgi:hypothetical protein
VQIDDDATDLASRIFIYFAVLISGSSRGRSSTTIAFRGFGVWR